MTHQAQQDIEQEFQIDVRLIVSEIWNKKFFISLITSIFSVIAVIYSLNLPNVYKSQALLKTSEEESSSASLLSQYGNVANFAGIQLPQSNSANQANMAVAILKSRSFLKHLIDQDPSISQFLMAAESYDINKRTIYFDPSKFDSEKNKWVREPKKGVGITPSYLEVHEYFMDIFKADIDQESGFIRLSVEHISPDFAESLLRLTISELNNITRNDDINSSQSALEYLYNEASKNTVTSIEFSISKLIESQLQTQMMAQIEPDYFLNIIDEPFRPEVKSSPNRRSICIISFLAGLILSSLYVVVSFIYRKEK